MANRLPLVIDAGEIEQLQSGDVLTDVVYAAATFGSNRLIRGTGTARNVKEAAEVAVGDDGHFTIITALENVVIGSGATASSITTGSQNVILGSNAGQELTSGIRNVLIGRNVGRFLTSEADNVLIGFSVGSNVSFVGSQSVFIGTLSGELATTASRCVFMGRQAGADITTGDDNTFVGDLAGGNAPQVGTASQCVIMGHNSQTTGNDAIVIGDTSIAAAGGIALGHDLSASANQLLLGGSSITDTILYGSVSIATKGDVVYAAAAFATDNVILRADGTGFGSQLSGLGITDNDQLTFPQLTIRIGDITTGPNVTGINNTLIGNNSGQLLVGGTGNFFLGPGSGSVCVIGNNNVGVGNASLLAVTGSTNVGVGGSSGATITTGDDNVFIGDGAGWLGQLATAGNSIGIGAGVVTTASNQMILGNTSINDTKIRGVVELKQTSLLELSGAHLPIFQILDSTGAASFEFVAFTQTSGNFVIGRDAGLAITTATNCLLIGKSAGKALTSGISTVLIGGLCGESITTGALNVAVGGSALKDCVTGAANTAVGAVALQKVTGSSNTGVGEHAGQLLTSGSQNVFIGRQAGGLSPQVGTVTNSVGIGWRAQTTGNDAIAIGRQVSASAKQCILGGTLITETILRGDVEIQNGTNTQRLFVYNTFTSDTDHEALVISWKESTNVATIETQKGSAGGTARALEFGTDGTTRITIGAAGDFTIADGENFIFNTGAGTQLGTAVEQKLGFWGAAPVVQPAAANQAALVNNTTGSRDGTLGVIGDTSTSNEGSNINDNFTDIHELLNEIRTALVAAGIMKGAAL